MFQIKRKYHFSKKKIVLSVSRVQVEFKFQNVLIFRKILSMHMILSVVSSEEYKFCELILELSLQERFFYQSGVTFVRVSRGKKRIYFQMYCCHIDNQFEVHSFGFLFRRQSKRTRIHSVINVNVFVSSEYRRCVGRTYC